MTAEAIAVTFFADYAAAEMKMRVVTATDLARLIEDTSAPAKPALPWLKLEAPQRPSAAELRAAVAYARLDPAQLAAAGGHRWPEL